MAEKSKTWVNTETGERLAIPDGFGDNLRVLGWEIEQDSPEPVKPETQNSSRGRSKSKQSTLN